MSPRTGPRQSRLSYRFGICLTLALIAGCGDSVPASPNPIPPPRPGTLNLRDLKSWHKPPGTTPSAKAASKR